MVGECSMSWSPDSQSNDLDVEQCLHCKVGCSEYGRHSVFVVAQLVSLLLMDSFLHSAGIAALEGKSQPIFKGILIL